MEMGIEPGRYIVGNELNSKNPVTGQPEFFLKKIVSQIRKALPGDSEKYLGTIVGLATGNPYLGAIAGGVGSGMSGAIGGGLTGFRSPGIKGFGSGFRMGDATKTGALDLRSLFKQGGMDEVTRFLTGEEGKSGLIASGGKFFSGGGDGLGSAAQTKKDQLTNKLIDGTITIDERENLKLLNSLSEKAKGSGFNFGDYIKYVGLGGTILKLLEDDSDIGPEPYKYAMTGESYPGVINQSPVYVGAQGGEVYAAKGGVMDLQDGGESVGPGTGTSDSIPAMLSDGEFVMTAKAVRGAGGGDRREGARKMYEAMDRLEARA